MKIYEIGTGYTPIPAKIAAATEIVVEELTRAFRKQNVPVEIIDIASGDRGDHDLPIREVKVPGCFSGTDVSLGIMHKLKRVAYSVCLAGELKKLLRGSQERVVLHFHNQYNLFFFLKLTPKKLRRRALIAYTNHSGIWRLDWQQIEGTIRKRYFQEAEGMRRADLVFLLNEETKANVMEHLGVPEERLRVICNGVNTDVYHPLSPEEKEQAKEKWGLSGRTVILQVGSVYENKGQLRSAEYLLPLLRSHPELVFAYAGGIVDGEYQEKIQQFARENNLTGQIRYLGMLSPGDELNRLYNTAAATICASEYEGFSLVLIESIAAGVPVLVNEASAFHIGAGCVTYNRENFCAVVSQRILSGEDGYRRLCEAARETALSRYGWARIARDHTDCFDT